MTKLDDGVLPSVAELYSGSPFFQNLIATDFHVWATHALPFVMKETSPQFDALVAGVQRIGRHMTGAEKLPTPHLLASDERRWIADAVTGVYEHLLHVSDDGLDAVLGYGGPNAVRETLDRLAVYLLELRAPLGYQAYLTSAGRYAQENPAALHIANGMLFQGPEVALAFPNVRGRAKAWSDRIMQQAGAPARDKAVPEDLPATVRHVVVMKSADHLSTAQKKDFKPIAGVPIRLAPAPDPASFVGAIRRSHPWLAEIAETMAMDLVGRDVARFRPTLLVGPPGFGKTAVARAVADAVGLPMTLYSCGGQADGSVIGTSRQWSTGRASVPLQAIIRSMLANPLVVLDEIDKAGTSTHNGNLVDGLLAFLERESSARLQDPYAECPVDLSHVSYIATANDLNRVPGPLRDRFRIFHVPAPKREHLPIIAQNLVHEIRVEAGPAGTFIGDLLPDELAMIAKHWKGGSMRALRRMVEVIVAGRDAHAARN